ALLRFAGQLADRGIRLLVLPVPGKNVIHPGPLLPPGRVVRPPLHNPSFGALMSRLEAAGVATYDPTDDLLALAASGRPVFLRGDSHWTPHAVERAAAEVARRVEKLAVLRERDPPSENLLRRPVVISGRGDLVTMLRLAEPDRLFRPELIEVRKIERADGASWRPRRGARVLLLGDSFTNVFSDPSLGWGSGAGLAEQLAFELDRPVDRIARNAGGAHETREQLARELASVRDRLAVTRVVVYQFAARELVSGNWRLVDLD
ncbi:MAG: hypothetical protein OES47_09250, partial [Acidobacteriota bacterium]|nr:hypothetical protein [Acidobacteriota bacterium]